MKHIFYLGDELVAGYGDPKALGWTGRVSARTLALGDDLGFHTLGVPLESTGELSSRWEEEVGRRLNPQEPQEETSAYLVIAIGWSDVHRRVSPTMTRLNIANILDRAHRLGMATMIVGPPPGVGQHAESIAELAAISEEAASRRHVPYIDLFGPLAQHEQWNTDLVSGKGGLPQQAGYGLIAWLVLHSQWHEWLGLQSPDTE